MFDLKTLLLPVDFSERSLEAARQAKGIAGHFHSRLIVLNVAQTDRTTDLQFEPGGSSAEELQSYFNRELRETPVEYTVKPGEPAGVIAACAQQTGADLIVMAGHSRGAFESFLLGSVTADVLCSAPCPVWVSLHPQKGPAPLFRRILCAIGLSDSTSKTLDWALGFADAFEATCDVIHVCDNSGGDQLRRITEDELTGAERIGLGNVRAKLGDRGKLILAAGDLRKAVGTAWERLESDLLVIGRSQAGNEVAHVHNLGLTLAHTASCPVVMI